MTDTGKQMYLGQPGTSAGNLYQAPTSGGNLAIIRNIVITNTTDSDAWVSLSIGTSGIDTAASRIFDKLNVPAVSTISHGAISWSGFIVMTASQYLTGKQGTSAAITVSVSGVEVT